MTDKRMRGLADRVEIADVLNEYCRTLDLMDLDTLGRLFTADCVVEYGPEQHLRSVGAAAVSAALQRLWRFTRTSHHLSNIQISLDGDDEAAAVSYVIAWHERPDGSTATLWGQYHDRLVRTIEGWRIARRRQVMNGNDAGFRVNIHKLERRRPPPGWIAPEVERPPGQDA